MMRSAQSLRTGMGRSGLFALIVVLALAAGACAGTTATLAPSASVPAASVPAASVPAASVPAASVPAASVPAARTGGTLRVGISGGILNADPHTSQDLQSWQILENVYGNLVRLDPSTLQPVGDIAQSWDESVDHLTWVFHIRPGVKFQNGRDVVAADVKFSLDRILNPATKATLASDLAPIASVEAADPSTVTIHLKQPYGILLPVLASPLWAAIIPPENVNSLATAPVGSGPFAFVSQVPKTSVTLKRFDGYWDQPKPNLDGIQYTVIPDATARLAALTSGQVDFIDSVPLDQVKSLESNSSVHLLSTTSTWTDEFGVNTNKKPFSDVRVRQAIAMAINKADVAKAATFGLGQPVDTMVSPASPIKIDVKGLPYDPQKAKQLLADAGYGNGFSFQFAPCGGTAFPEMIRASQVIANELQQIGIQATAITQDPGVWANDVITTHNYDAFVCGLIGGIDPDQRTYRYFHTNGAYNFSLYKPTQELDSLLDQGRQTSDVAQRSTIYTQAWTTLAQDVPWIPLYWVPETSAATSTVQGFTAMPDFNLRFETVSIGG